MRLLTATDPIINVPSDKNDRASIEKADLIERLCNAVIYQSGRIMQNPCIMTWFHPFYAMDSSIWLS